MIDVRRKKGESFDNLLRRFKRRVQQSGQLLQAKKVRFHQNDPNKTRRKRSALHRISVAEEREYLTKTGKLPDDERTNKHSS